jgi:nucleoside 2-deoxyribosyltransferase
MGYFMAIPFPLISDIANGRCLPFVGAGFSKNAILPADLSMPDWSELTNALAKDAGTPPGTQPTAVAQRYEQKFGRVQLIETVRDALHPEKARPGKAHRAFVQLPFDTIYTTNFDLLLEDAYFEAARPFRSLVGELQLPFHAGQIASSVIKMHGDLRHEEHMVITKNDYDAFMERYPVVATHLSAMLITRTPLFLGYSLSDPDFENIRKIVRSRLGVFERMAYVIQFDVSPENVEKALDSKLHIISVDSSTAPTRGEALANLLEGVQKQLDIKSSSTLRNSRPDIFEEIPIDISHTTEPALTHSTLIESTSHLCFVMMPFSEGFNEIYRMLISPAVEGNGLSVLRADELSNPGFIVEQIRTAIQQSRVCVADLTGLNPNVMWEVGYASSNNKPLIMLAAEGTRLPFDISHQRILFYTHDDLSDASSKLQQMIFNVLSQDRLKVAVDLFDLKQYRGAIAASAVVLEHTLRQLVSKQKTDRSARLTMGNILHTVARLKLLPASSITQLRKVMELRNSAVHEIDEPNREQAEFVISTIRKVLDGLPNNEPQ